MGKYENRASAIAKRQRCCGNISLQANEIIEKALIQVERETWEAAIEAAQTWRNTAPSAPLIEFLKAAQTGETVDES